MSKFNITQLLGIFHLQLKHLKSKISHGTFTHFPTPGPNPIDLEERICRALGGAGLGEVFPPSYIEQIFLIK